MKTTLLTTTLLLLTTHYIMAQTTAIPDPNFEQALIDLGFDSDGTVNGEVLTSDIEGILQLEVQGYNISDLTGIQDMPFLQNLFCFDNNISSLDLSENDLLFNLHCQDNNLSSLDISANPALRFLFAHGNNITGIDVGNNNALETLNLGNNQITSIDITNLDDLKGFSIEGNMLTGIDFTQNTDLEWFNIRNNAITSLDVSNNLFLEEIYMDDNGVSGLDVSNNPVLVHLFAGNNNIIALDLSQNPGLETVAVYNNQLVQLDIKNGNTANITPLIAEDNPNLACIQVDEGIVGNIPATWSYDTGVSFSSDCGYLGIGENSLSNISVYPNPATGAVHIGTLDHTATFSLRLYTLQGQTIREAKGNTIPLDGIGSGTYLLEIQGNGFSSVKRIIKD